MTKTATNVVMKLNKGIAIILASCLVCVVLVYNAMHGEILTNPN